MSLTVKETGGSGYAPIEAGTYPARCAGVVDLGIQFNERNGKHTEKVIIFYELPGERIVVGGEDKPQWISKIYTASLNEKSTLFKDLCAWRGRPFTQEELAGFHLEKVVGTPCTVSIVNVERDGKRYANISGISKAMRGVDTPELENEPIIFDMEDEEAQEKLKKVPEWVQKLIEKSPTWQAIVRARSGNQEAPEFSDVNEEDEGELPF